MSLSVYALSLAVFILVISVVIAVYVYRDAARRNMTALLWAIIAAFVPSFIGLIIYLLVRGNFSNLRCPKCDAPVTEQFVVCPKCGSKLRPTCPNCAIPVARDWKVCPKCTQPLPEIQAGYQSPTKTKDRSLAKILVIVLIVPVLLISLAVIGFHAVSGGAATAFRECSFDEYRDEMNIQGATSEQTEVMNWLNTIRASIEPNQAYALRYDHESSNEHFFLVFVPNTGDTSHRNGLRQSYGLFGVTVKLALERTGNDEYLINVVSSAEKAPDLLVEVGGKRIPCNMTVVNYNPTVYHIFSQQNTPTPATAE